MATNSAAAAAITNSTVSNMVTQSELRAFIARYARMHNFGLRLAERIRAGATVEPGEIIVDPRDDGMGWYPMRRGDSFQQGSVGGFNEIMTQSWLDDREAERRERPEPQPTPVRTIRRALENNKAARANLDATITKMEADLAARPEMETEPEPEPEPAPSMTRRESLAWFKGLVANLEAELAAEEAAAAPTAVV